MIVCINCRAETKSKMDILLSQGQYKDYSEIIAVAVDNLCLMEQEVAKTGAFIVDASPSPSTAAVASLRAEKAKPLNPRNGVPGKVPQAKIAKAGPITAALTPVHIPDLFLCDGLDSQPAVTTEVLHTEETEKAFTLDRWLFGQYNKLLPIKANCRALLRIAAEHPDGVPLEDIAPQICEAAMLLGDYLAEHDRRHHITRDDSLATAFPRSGSDANKSRARYANQFIGIISRQGVLSGMLWDYRLAALLPGAGARMRLTQPALQFALLANPILDGCQTYPAQKFSSEERAFLIKHIFAHVPVEAFAFRSLLQAIADGAVTPNQLDEALRVYVPTETNRSLSTSFLASQRSGALSRMADLGLITRERKGVRVSYTITADAKEIV